MRFFIALEIPEDCKKQIKIVQNALSNIVPSVRLTKTEKVHLTIAFIGEQPNSLKTQLTQIMQKAVKDIPPFQVSPAYLDAFPNLHQPHTFWIGVKGDIDKLMVLRERVKDGLIELGIGVDERRYIPHIAIGKINNHYSLSRQQEEALASIMLKASFVPIQISSLKLFESVPEAGFHRHNTLAEILLEGK